MPLVYHQGEAHVHRIAFSTGKIISTAVAYSDYRISTGTANSACDPGFTFAFAANQLRDGCVTYRTNAFFNCCKDSLKIDRASYYDTLTPHYANSKPVKRV